MPTRDECKRILFKLGIKHGISPRLISERLLSDLDKRDMMAGELDIASLEANLELWKAYGIPDFRTPEEIKTGLNHRPEHPNETAPVSRPVCYYREPFQCHSLRHDCLCRQGKTYREL